MPQGRQRVGRLGPDHPGQHLAGPGAEHIVGVGRSLHHEAIGDPYDEEDAVGLHRPGSVDRLAGTVADIDGDSGREEIGLGPGIHRPMEVRNGRPG